MATRTTVEITMPQMGESVTEGTILEWRKQVGDPGEQDEALLDVSTDKVDPGVPWPAPGTLTKILVQPEETVPTATVLGRIAAGAGAPAAPRPAEPEAPKAAPVANGDGNATPVASRMASANGIDVSSLKGSGPRGRVTKEDVEAALAGNGAQPAADVKPIRGPAATLVRFMNESRSIPTATSFRTLEVDTLDARRKVLKGEGKKLSFTHLIAWAIVQAAGEMPVMSHAYAEDNGTAQRVTPDGVSLGLAVDVERKDGTRSLVVPVIKQADRLDFPTFAAKYDELVVGARDNTLPPEAYQGANITLTNPGGIGTVASVPRLMPGQGTIVATGAIGYPPGLGSGPAGNPKALGGPKGMTMTSPYDHRGIQGAESGAFLRKIDQLLQGEDGFYESLFGALQVPLDAPQRDGAGPVTAAEPAPSQVTPALTGAPDEALLQAVQAATSLVKAHRMHGHLAARLDPLRSAPDGDPAPG